ncbi:hypothetical protein Baya_1915 [Bagarius yarrelli]|uniref:Uncharacterized protein n=1 Tax=Bagarius yarrelli TaxID=175774 RepID=A0A556TMH0_BAGYA|nr:hypothetical protein Baya_1915 [Bagarius yarrelli]
MVANYLKKNGEKFVYVTVWNVLLLLSVWPTSAIPVTFCQNTERQIESIRNLLHTVKRTVNGACAVIQRLTSYQACEFDLFTEIPELTYMKAETKGLVENLQGFRTDDCVLSPAVCPYSHLSMWSKTDVLLSLWSQDVAACKNVIQSMCSSPNYNMF